ncbi:MAG: Uma2 family endonuclease [Rubrobacter sp.]
MTAQTKPVTAEELLKMPDDGLRRELVRGELREMTPAGDEHGYLASEIASELRNHVKANQLGRTYTAETGFKISSDPDTVRAPDAAFVNRERVETAGRVVGFRDGAPDLVVEVASPNDRNSEVLDKALDWLEAGCRMVLVAHPERRAVTVYRSREEIRVLTAEAGDVVDGADVVPGWKLPLAEIFA